jgi:hypothetical protein
MAVTNLAGEILILVMVVGAASIGSHPFSRADFVFCGFMAIGPACGIWQAIKTIRQTVLVKQERGTGD